MKQWKKEKERRLLSCKMYTALPKSSVATRPVTDPVAQVTGTIKSGNTFVFAPSSLVAKIGLKSWLHTLASKLDTRHS
jgi:hypothetical protein